MRRCPHHTLAANVTWGTVGGFPSGKAAIFDGSGASGGTSHASASSTTLENFSATTPFLVSAWVNTAGSARYQVIAGNVGTGDKGWEMNMNSASGPNIPQFNIFSSLSGGQELAVDADHPPPTPLAAILPITFA